MFTQQNIAKYYSWEVETDAQIHTNPSQINKKQKSTNLSIENWISTTESYSFTDFLGMDFRHQEAVYNLVIFIYQSKTILAEPASLMAQTI